MPTYHYVYILKSDSHPTHHDTGLTDDLRSRLSKHNEGGTPDTSDFRPWSVKTALAFDDPARAANFERYLKTSSGRAFAKKTPMSCCAQPRPFDLQSIAQAPSSHLLSTLALLYAHFDLTIRPSILEELFPLKHDRPRREQRLPGRSVAMPGLDIAVIPSLAKSSKRVLLRF
jgi:putative endonuclease